MVLDCIKRHLQIISSCYVLMAIVLDMVSVAFFTLLRIKLRFHRQKRNLVLESKIILPWSAVSLYVHSLVKY